MDLHLYIDTQTRKLVNGPDDRGTFTFPSLYQGDGVTLYLHGLKPNTDPANLAIYEEAPIAFTGIKCGLGLGPDAAPSAGTFRVRLKGQEETTAPLPFNVAPAAFLAAVNGLATVQAVWPTGITLAAPPKLGSNFFLIRWTNALITQEFEIVENQLEPLCFVRSTPLQLPGGKVQILKFIVAPLAFTGQFSFPAAAQIEVASVRTGNGNRNCVQALHVPYNARGTVSFTFETNSTAIVAVEDLAGVLTDGSATLQAALNAIYSDGLTRFNVSKQDTELYYVEFVGPLEKTDFDPLGVEMHEQAPLDTPMGLLHLDGPSLEFALHGQPSIKLTFELEITNGSDVVTAVQTLVTIVNDMLDDAMQVAVSDPTWLQPPSTSYPPYIPQSTITGFNCYVGPLGSGVGQGTAGTSFVVTHNLGTLNCHVTVRETGGAHHRLPDNEYVTTYLNTDQIQVDFAAPPADGQYEIIISSAVPSNIALPHHTHPISDIDGLAEIIAAWQAQGNTLDLWPNIPDSKLPLHIGWRNPNDPKALRFDVVPDELIPDNIPRLDMPGRTLPIANLPPGVPYIDPSTGALVVQMPGPPPYTVVLLDNTGHIPVATLPLDPSGWPGLIQAVLKALQAGATVQNLVVIQIDDISEQFPPAFTLSNHCPGDDTVSMVPSAILPALFNAPLAGDLSNGLPLPSTTGVVGKRFTVAGKASSSATIFRERQQFLNGDVIASNGYHWYAVETLGNASYPSEYNRQLFAFYVSEDMLALGCRFALDFTLQARFKSADDILAQYLLTVEIGTPGAASGPGIGVNLNNVNWYAPVIQRTIILGGATVFHRFGYAVNRPAPATTGGAVPPMTAERTLYASTSLPATVPQGPAFAVRATLSRFDVQDDVPNPSGQIILKMAKALASVVKANS